MRLLPDPFLAELPAEFDTGRINSTNAFFIDYANSRDASDYPDTWGLQHWEKLPYNQTTTLLSELSDEFDSVHNKGPLLTLALALFGEGSFIAPRAENPEAYATGVVRSRENENRDSQKSDAYIDKALLSWLDSNSRSGPLEKCITNKDGGEDGWGIPDLIVAWLAKFRNDNVTVADAFTHSRISRQKGMNGISGC
ncbi:hypothetical protein BDV12DRAFT_204276 [Aspergillus spectabilis]